MENLKKSTDTIKQSIGEIFGNVKVEAFSTIQPYLDKIITWFTDNKAKIAGFFLGIPDIAKRTFQLVKDMLSFTFSMDFWGNYGKNIGYILIAAFEGIFDTLITIVKAIGITIWEPLKVGFLLIGDTIQDAWYAITEAVGNAFNSIINGIINSLNKPIKMINEMLSNPAIRELLKMVTGGEVTIKTIDNVSRTPGKNPADGRPGRQIDGDKIFDSWKNIAVVFNKSIDEIVASAKENGQTLGEAFAPFIEAFKIDIGKIIEAKEGVFADNSEIVAHTGKDGKNTKQSDDEIITIFSVLQKSLGELGDISINFKNKSIALKDTLRTIIPELKNIGKNVSGLLVPFGDTIDKFLGSIADKIGSFFSSIGNGVGKFLGPVADKIGEFFSPIGDKIKEKAASIIGSISTIGTMAAGPLGPIIEQIASALMSIENVGAVFNAITTIVTQLAEILGPILNEMLAPLVIILQLIGEVIGMVLAPILGALTTFITPILNIIIQIITVLKPVIMLIGQLLGLFLRFNPIMNLMSIGIQVLFGAIAAVYNYVIMPIANVIIQIIGFIANAIANVANFIINILNHLPGVNIRKVSGIDTEAMKLQKIDLDATAEEHQNTSGYGTESIGISTSGSGSYSAAKDVIVNIYFNNSYVNGDARQIALSLKAELEAVGALGY